MAVAKLGGEQDALKTLDSSLLFAVGSHHFDVGEGAPNSAAGLPTVDGQ